MPRRALIVGLGLIGGSIGIALRSRGWFVAYDDPFVDDGGQAADEKWDSVREDVDLIVLATPVEVARSRGREVEGLEPRDPATPRPVITSVASVMSPFAGRPNFVAGHPLAGSEQRGLGAARGDLFEGKKWFVERDEAIVDEMIADCGATKVVVDPAEHDRAVALTSHLPQILSTALAAAEPDPNFAGSGLATFLRLAGSDASVWAPVIAANRDNIRAAFERVVAIARTIIDDDPYEAFAKAQRFSQ